MVLIFIILLSILLAEHFGRIYGIRKRPSYFLGLLSEYSTHIFNFIGIQIARLSSFVLYLKMDELMITVWSILEPIFYITISPVNVIIGYFSQALKYQYKTWQIYLGSIIIVIILSTLALNLALKNTSPESTIDLFDV